MDSVGPPLLGPFSPWLPEGVLYCLPFSVRLSFCSQLIRSYQAGGNFTQMFKKSSASSVRFFLMCQQHLYYRPDNDMHLLFARHKLTSHPRLIAMIENVLKYVSLVTFNLFAILLLALIFYIMGPMFF